MHKRLVAGLGLALTCSGAHAVGGHYAVDDAALVEPGRCELEGWYARADGDNDDYTVVGACNPWGNLELGLGASRLQTAGERDTVAEVGAKLLFRELTPGGFGWGLAVATTYGGALERLEGAAAYLPLSVDVAEGLVLNYNLGWAHERDGDDAAIWGVNGIYQLAPGWGLIAEAYGTHRGGTELQAGLRYEIGPARLDLGYGRARADSDDDWYTLGLGWAF